MGLLRQTLTLSMLGYPQTLLMAAMQASLAISGVERHGFYISGTDVQIYQGQMFSKHVLLQYNICCMLNPYKQPAGDLKFLSHGSTLTAVSHDVAW